MIRSKSRLTGKRAYRRLASYAVSHGREGKEKGNEVTWLTPPLKEVTREEGNLASRYA
jgi:hypothetical protein